MGDLNRVRELIFEMDNKACFIERDRILTRLAGEMKEYMGEDKYAIVLSKVLSEVSVPIEDCDYFAGRVVEGLPADDFEADNRLLYSVGHMSFDYEKFLRLGLSGILAEIKENAAKKGDPLSLSFAKNAEIVVNAIRDYSLRYAEEAEKKGRKEMAEALKKVPYGPAYDFFSALQGMWIVHMVASCYVGSRDYAFGRFDKYMLPFYEKAIAEGHTREELTELLAGFMIKANEICGRATWNHDAKPTPSQASKQYINIGGEHPNVMSSVVLDAAKLCDMVQPTTIVLLKPEADEQFTNEVFEALSVLTARMNVYNYDLVSKALMNKGIEEDVAKDFTYSACCTLDLNYHSFRLEYFVPVPRLFLKSLKKKEYANIDEVCAEFSKVLEADMQIYADETQKGFTEEECRRQFVLDSIMLSDSAVECRYACDGTSKYNVLNLFCTGIATIGDSLMVLDKLVFKEKRYTYSEFMEILNSNYEGKEDLRQEILSYTRFGNDTDNDSYATAAGNAFLDAVDRLTLKDNFYAVGGFYTLERENSSKKSVGATPDGRLDGDPFSENQSPTYGADKNGITALLKSISKLPLERTATGGLNLSFSQKVEPHILKALVLSYFSMGGYHTGVGIIDAETLKDAMKTPDKYKSLTVRLYGFSEYFISLPEWQQIAVLNRTCYNM